MMGISQYASVNKYN